jgi:hypothetical protein
MKMRVLAATVTAKSAVSVGICDLLKSPRCIQGTAVPKQIHRGFPAIFIGGVAPNWSRDGFHEDEDGQRIFV